MSYMNHGLRSADPSDPGSRCCRGRAALYGSDPSGSGIRKSGKVRASPDPCHGDERRSCSAAPRHTGRRVASTEDLDLGAQRLSRKSAIPSHTDRSLRTVAGHDPAVNLKAVLAKPYHTRSDELLRAISVGDVNDRLVAVLAMLALAERDHRPRQFGVRHACGATAPYRIRASHASRREATARPTPASWINAGVRRPSARP